MLLKSLGIEGNINFRSNILFLRNVKGSFGSFKEVRFFWSFELIGSNGVYSGVLKFKVF